MRKLVRLLPALVLVVFMLAGGVAHAADASLLLGQNHNYSVHFRSNGEAIVSARVVFHNRDADDLKKISLSIPGSVYEVYALQQILPKTCDKYTYSYGYNGESTCAKESDPDYTDQYYGYYQNDDVVYKKIKPDQEGEKYTFSLPTPVAEDKSGALIISYASKSYTSKNFGKLKFDFQTFKADERIQKAKVAITFDDDIYYNGKKSSVQYAPEASSGINALADSAATSNKSLQSYVSNIGDSGVITKNSSNLAPGDTYHVTGTYATSWMGLYGMTLFWTVFGFAALFVAGYFFSRWRARKGRGPKNDADHQDQSSTPNEPSPQPVQHDQMVGRMQAFPTAYKEPMKVLKLTVTPMFGSFLYALFSVVLTGVAGVVILVVAAVSLHGNSYDYTGPQEFGIGLAVAAGAIAALIGLFTLPIVIARKRGLRYLFTTLVFEVVWLLVAMAVIGIFTKAPDTTPTYIDDTYNARSGPF